MPKTWAEVSESEEFKGLYADQQEDARRQYFEDIVQPNVPEQDQFRARMMFDRDTAQTVSGPPEPRGIKENVIAAASKAQEFIKEDMKDPGTPEGYKPGTYGTPYDEQINQYASEYGNDPNMIYAIGQHESAGWDPKAESYTGVKGLMQVTGGTAKDIRKRHPEITEDHHSETGSIRMGNALWSDLVKEFDGNTRDALMAYNGGSGAVKRWIKNGRPESGEGLSTREDPEKRAAKIKEVLEYPDHVMKHYKPGEKPPEQGQLETPQIRDLRTGPVQATLQKQFKTAKDMVTGDADWTVIDGVIKRIPEQAKAIGASGMQAVFESGAGDYLGGLQKGLAHLGGGVAMPGGTVPMEEATKGAGEARAMEYHKVWMDAQNRMQEIRTEATKGDPGSEYLYDVISLITDMGPAIAGGVLTGNPNITLMLMGGQAATGTYSGRRYEGEDPGMAAISSVYTGAVEALTEKIPMGYLFKEKDILQKILKVTVGEGLQESASSVLQSLWDVNTITPDMTFAEAMKAAGYEGLLGAGAGAGLAATYGAGEKLTEFGSKAYDKWRTRNLKEGELLGPEEAPTGARLTGEAADDYYMHNVPDAGPTLGGPVEGAPQLPAPETPQEKAANQIRSLWEQDFEAATKEEGIDAWKTWQSGFMSAVNGEGPKSPSRVYIMGRMAADKAGLSTYKAEPEKATEKPAQAAKPVATAPEIGQTGITGEITKKVEPAPKPSLPAETVNQVMDEPGKALAKDVKGTAEKIGLSTAGSIPVVKERIKAMAEAYDKYGAYMPDDYQDMSVKEISGIQKEIGLPLKGKKADRITAVFERMRDIGKTRDPWIAEKDKKAAELSKFRSDKAKKERKPNALTDDLLTLAAKMGGIGRDAASGIGVDPAYFKEKKGIHYPFVDAGMSVDAFALELAQMGFDVTDSTGAVDATKAEELIHSALGGERVMSPQGMELDLQGYEFDEQEYAAMYGESVPEDVVPETVSLDKIAAEYEDVFGEAMYEETFQSINEANDTATDEEFDIAFGIELKRQLDEKQKEQPLPEAEAKAEGRRKAQEEVTIERREGAPSRRRDWAMRKDIDSMGMEERAAVIDRLRRDARINQLTKIKNWDAWNEDDKGTWIVSMDIDNLGWVNDNIGEAFGDKLLIEAAKELKAALGDNVYHKSGDEFWAHGNNKAQLENQLKQAAEALQLATIRDDAGNVMEGINFSYGITKDRTSADRAMKRQKAEREAQGLRVPKTTRPEGITLVGETDKYQEGVERELDELEAATFDLNQPEGEVTPEAEKQEEINYEDQEIAGKKPPSGGSTLHANPLGVMYKEWQNTVDWVGRKVFDAGVWKFTALKQLPAERVYLKARYKTLGKIANVEKVTRKVYDTFVKATPEDAQEIFNFLTDRGGDPSGIIDDEIRHRAVATKKLIWRVGKALVDRGMLSEEAWRAHENAYLPRIYLRYLLGEETYRGLAAGKKPSKMDWAKMRKDIPEEVREIVLGEVTDPAFLASRGLGVQMRDIALIDFLDEISQNENWIFPNTMVEWNGHRVTVQWLQNESEMIQKQAAYYTEEQRYRALALVKQIDAIVEPVLEELNKMPKDFKQFPDIKRYGRLRGMWVRKEIYDDILGTGTIISNDSSPAEMLLGYGGVLTKANQLWKTSKVALNPPTQMRNLISNGVLLNLSGVPLHEIPGLTIKAIREIRTNGKHWRIAKKYGVTESTYANNELFRIERDLVDLESRRSNSGTPINIATLKNIGGMITDFAGDTYQLSESLFKTMKIIHAMEREGMSESDASLEAQKWLYDYSLIPGSVRYLRNAPVGVPFMTFYYKTFPRIVETAFKHPHRYAPYVIMPFILAALIADDNDVEKEDVDKLRKAIPSWLEERGNAYIYPYKDENGRWQVVDIGYFLPWSMFTEATREAAAGKFGDAWQTVGMLGGPFPDIITATKTGIDPFTKKPIYNENDPPGKQVTDIFSYMYRLAAPSWITDIGFAGRLHEALTDEVDPRTGDPKLTTSQAMLRLFGINVYPIEPKKTRAKNLAYMKYDINDTKRRMSEMLRNKNNTEEDNDRIRKSYNELIKEKARLLRKYADESEIHPNLDTEL